MSDGTRTYTWQHGRQMATVTQNGETWVNTYNADGLLVKCSSDRLTYTYVYNGSQLTQVSVGGETMRFIYDESGVPIILQHNGQNYYYVTNPQGDVLAIVDSNGYAVATYLYDPWGKVLDYTVEGDGVIGSVNPFRYRGYIYNLDTELYYLQSRYYDPALRRFLNADAYTSTGQGLLGNNMFTYCGNNAVVNEDPYGTCYFNANGQWCHDNWEYLAGYVRREAPVDITERLNKAMMENEQKLREYYRTHSFVQSVQFFVERVKTGGEWDLKNQDSWNLDPDTRYAYNGTELRYDDVGNIHYGYVGRVLFQTDVLLKAGGLIQIFSGTSDWSFKETNFDDPRDQWAIRFGSELWDWGVLYR